MPSLADYQRAMRAYLLDACEEPRALLPWCTGDASVAAARLAIYRNTCSGTLVNALRLSYPAVRRVLGADFFDMVAGQFLRIDPPLSAYLNDYGEPFGQFMAALPATAKLPYLHELARLEWAVNRALHASDVPQLDPQRLGALTAEETTRLCFRVHPAVTVLALHFPAEQIWQAVLEGDEEAMRGIDLSAGSGWVLIERDATHTVQVRRLSETVGRLSASLFAGAPLQVALDAAGEAADARQLQATLADHLGSGRLIDFHLQNTLREERTT